MCQTILGATTLVQLLLKYSFEISVAMYSTLFSSISESIFDAYMCVESAVPTINGNHEAL